MAIYLFSGNRTELLSKRLSFLLSSNPLPSPFDREIIVTQTKGMERWISLEMASHSTVFANFQSITPDALLTRILAPALGIKKETGPFAAGNLKWGVMKALGSEMLSLQEFKKVRRYVGDDELKLFQLSSALSDLFDQYVVYRPEMIEKWQKGELQYSSPDEKWQMLLFRKLEEFYADSGLHKHEFKKRLIDRLGSLTQKEADALPARISFFGISVLPLFYFDILSLLEPWMDILIFLLNPCSTYWGDISSEKEAGRKKARGEDYIEIGNTLLANLGSLGRDFFTSVHDLPISHEEPLFQDPAEYSVSLLATLQSDMMHLDMGMNPQPDNSVTLASCHSPLREVEVLYDHMLELLRSDTSLQPADFIVMTPDIEQYTPYIDAVFANRNEGIPYTVADRTFGRESRIAEVFLSILELTQRFEAPRVLEICENSIVFKKFGLEHENFEKIRHWIRESGIRWGMDGESKAALGLPAGNQNTWKSGVARMLAGYAMPCANESFYRGILPFEAAEGREAGVLGSFLEMVSVLMEHVSEFADPRDIDGWTELFENIVETMFNIDSDSERDILYLRRSISTMREQGIESGYDLKIPFEVVRSHMKEYVSRESVGRGFISGGVTFCSMKPMRSIPFAHVFLLGMNDDAFPRKVTAYNFDLMSKHPKKGDRNIREQDRYLFLETILSARKGLYISWIGRSVKSNEPLFPSTVVSEFVDTLRDDYGMEFEIEEHPLQAFSMRYFTEGSPLFSYSKDDSEFAANLLSQRKEIVEVPMALPEEEAERISVTVNDLIRFFRNPARFIYNRRLGIYPQEEEPKIEEHEHFYFDPLEFYKIKSDILECVLRDGKVSMLMKRLRAEGRLPHGHVGKTLFKGVVEDIREYAESLYGRIGGLEPGVFEVDIKMQIGDHTVNLGGRFGGIYNSQLFRYRPVRIAKAKDMVDLWIGHILLSMDRRSESTFMAEKKSVVLPPVRDPEDRLRELVEIFIEGSRRPLLFAPEFSSSYARNFNRSHDAETAFHGALSSWEWGSEKDDPVLKDVFEKSGIFEGKEEAVEQFHKNATLFFGDLVNMWSAW